MSICSINNNITSYKQSEVEEKNNDSLIARTSKVSQSRLSAPITGFAEYDPTHQYAFTNWLKQLETVYERHGFSPIHLRPLERLSALQGDTENQKQIFGVYRADTQLDTGLGLPFDHTVPLALYVAEYASNKNLPLPYKRYDTGLSYRGEHAQAGRFRGFVQADVDIVGRHLDLSADTECICTLLEGLEALGIQDFHVNINHINIVKGIMRANGIPEEFHPAVLRVIDKLDKLTPEQAAEEILQIESFPFDKTAVDNLISCFTTPVTSLSDFQFEKDYGSAANQGLEDLKQVVYSLEMMGINPNLFQFNPGMVRGLDYYTGIIFETFLNEKSRLGSIASGGRYSNLIGRFAEGLEDIEGVGGSIGLTRLFDIIDKRGLFPRKTVADVLVGYRTQEQRNLATQIATLLRENDFKVDVYSGQPNVKKTIKHGDDLGVPYVVMAMDENAIAVKDMYAAGGKNKEREPDLASPEEVLHKLKFLQTRV